MRKGPVMDKRITRVAMDDSKRTIVAGILRRGATEPELRSIPNEPWHLRRFFQRLQREGCLIACYEAGPSGYDLYRQLTARYEPDT
jgi:transposase